MAIKLSTAARNGEGDAITTAVGSAGLLRIYDGTRPANPGTAITSQTKLAELTCGTPFAPASSGGVVTANAITTNNAIATSTASWFRLTTSGGTAVIDGDVGTSGSDLNLNTTSIVSGGPVAVTSFVLTVGNA